MTSEARPFEPPHHSVVHALHTLWCAGLRGNHLRRKLKDNGVQVSDRDIARTLNYIMETRVAPRRATPTDIHNVNAWLRQFSGGKWGRKPRV